MAESKQDKFHRLAEKRMIGLLRAFRLVGNLSGANYEYNQNDIDKILAAIDDAKEQLEYRFAEPNKADDVSFSFAEPEDVNDGSDRQPLENEPAPEGYEETIETD